MCPGAGAPGPPPCSAPLPPTPVQREVLASSLLPGRTHPPLRARPVPVRTLALVRGGGRRGREGQKDTAGEGGTDTAGGRVRLGSGRTPPFRHHGSNYKIGLTNYAARKSKLFVFYVAPPLHYFVVLTHTNTACVWVFPPPLPHNTATSNSNVTRSHLGQF